MQFEHRCQCSLCAGGENTYAAGHPVYEFICGSLCGQVAKALDLNEADQGGSEQLERTVFLSLKKKYYTATANATIDRQLAIRD